MSILVIILLAFIGLTQLLVFGILTNICKELEKQTRQADNNKVLIDVIGDMTKNVK